jgi:hypothetical protein
MRRRIIALGLAGLMALNVTTSPASAADLGMPLKAPPIVAPPPEADWLPLAAAALIATGVALCIALCEENHGPTPPVSPGALNPHS